ncbi:hypothetical protein SBRCBS47491_009944 [Sporothrix bragantina]|uniref:Methylitaconate delta2-delta3-isomerase n=1 Tax=Sporothrix bragantina TaxID=671064 RepID=A0ABP0D1H6_9PEZI
MAHVDQVGIPCAYIRGGTSKAMFFHEKDLPPPGPLRDTIFKRLMGTPDSHQIDGVGGATTHTSKIALICPPSREDADVDFTFVHVFIERDAVSYTGNCGNISSAVGPFAIDEGIVTTFRKGRSTDDSLTTREVRIHQTNTKSILVAHVTVDPATGYSVTAGGASISGVPGTSAPILMDYSHSTGGVLGRGLLPTGNALDHITVEGQDLEVSILDVGNVTIFVRAADVGLTGTEPAGQITSNAAVIARCKELRGKGAQRVGMCTDWRLVDEQATGLPVVTMVAPPEHDQVDVNARLVYVNRCHDTMAGTGAICLAGASRVQGTVVWSTLSESSRASDVLRINHPAGPMPIWAKRAEGAQRARGDEFEILAFERTSRRLMTGTVFVPKTVCAGSA